MNKYYPAFTILFFSLFFQPKADAQPGGCGCQANFYQQMVGGNPLQYQFFDFSCYDTTLTPTFFNWDFGDGTTAMSQMNPIHTFPGSGSYTVCLYLFNGNTGTCCIDTVCKDIFIDAATGLQPMPEFHPEVITDYSSGKIIITLPAGNNKPSSLYIFSFTGSLISYTGINPEQKRVEMALPEKSGIYHLYFVSGKQRAVQKIFVNGF